MLQSLSILLYITSIDVEYIEVYSIYVYRIYTLESEV